MKAFRFLAVLLVIGLFINSCSDSDNDSGTTGGSGEVKEAAATAKPANNEPASTESNDTAVVEQEPSEPAVSRFFADFS